MMQEKKTTIFKSPDLSKLQEVIMDDRTRIYIAKGADPEKARRQYNSKKEARNIMYANSRKPLSGQ